MDPNETSASLGHLTKTALPVIGRVGTVTGGIVSLLAVLDAVSDDLVIIGGGVLLIAAVVTSAITVFHSTTRVVEENKVKTYTYPKRARTIATIIMVVAGVLLTIGGVSVALSRIGMFNRQAGRAPVAKTSLVPPQNSKQTGDVKQGTLVAQGTPIRSTIIPTNPPPTFTPSPINTPTITPPPGTPTRTPTFTPVAIDQMSDVSQLNKLGADAIKAMNLVRAQAAFNRALQIEATNAQSQLGLGITYFYLNNHQPAITPLSTALKLDTKLVEAHAYLGFIYDYRQDYVRAKAEYDEFLRIAPKDSPLRDNVDQRNKLIAGKSPAPTLTPFATPTVTVTPEK